MTVVLFADVPAYKILGEFVDTLFQDTIREVSYIYEQQMHIELQLGATAHWTKDDMAPSYAKDDCGEDFMSTKLNLLGSEGKKTANGASVQLFTGCGNGTGVIGLAAVAAICSARNVGVNQLQGANPWLIYAHELGHNFAARHSFEDGKGTTGGIMDYADGKLDGVYQFNTKYRKSQVCEFLNRTHGHCTGYWPSNSTHVVAPPETSIEQLQKFVFEEGGAVGKHVLAPLLVVVVLVLLSIFDGEQ